jgi:hypothetical protein
MCLFQPCFSDKTNNLEAYVKWFNRLCYLVATEICMVSRKPGGHGGLAWPKAIWGNWKAYGAPTISKPRTRLATPPGHQVHPFLQRHVPSR